MKHSKYSASAGLYHALRNGTVAKMKPISVKDVLLKTWAQDTAEMANATIREHKYETGQSVYYGYQLVGTLIRAYTQDYDMALAEQIAYLNSAAEVGK